jgi:hydroxyacyl-ACP dehydratase HTD2-like protein with hotdog domain
MPNDTQIYFENISVGDKLTPFTVGPLTTTHLMRWSAAMENWHKIHYDLPFTKKHENLPNLLVNGSFKQQFMVKLLKDWCAPHGWLWKIKFQFRAMNQVNETLRAWATVTDTRKTDDFGLVDLEIGLLNNEDKESTPGTATVALPYKDGKPVPYPFIPPKE